MFFLDTLASHISYTHTHPPLISMWGSACMPDYWFGVLQQQWIVVFSVCCAHVRQWFKTTKQDSHTHTHRVKKLLTRIKKNTCLSLLSPSPCLLLFFSPLTLFFVCLFVFLPLKSFPTVSLLLANSPPLSIGLFSPLSLSPSPERHYPDCKQRWWITNCPALVALGWRQLCGWVDWDMVMSCVCKS